MYNRLVVPKFLGAGEFGEQICSCVLFLGDIFNLEIVKGSDQGSDLVEVSAKLWLFRLEFTLDLVGY